MARESQGAGAWWDVDDAAYHADLGRVSHHMLEVFRASVPRYHGLYVARTLAPPEPTEAMTVGAALHCACLEPDAFAGRWAVAPRCDRRTKAGKAAWEQFQADAAGKRVLDEGQARLVQALRGGVLANELAREILDGAGWTERAVRWTHPGGIEMRSRPDKVTRGGVVPDLKTTDGEASPAAWAREVARYGLHRQAALYLQAVDALPDMVGAGAMFLWVVVSKRPPHECAVYAPSPETLRQGRAENDLALKELEDRLATGDWASRHAGVNTVELPRWAAADPVPY